MFLQMLSSLFEASSKLSEDSLVHLVKALITISGESLQLAYNNREPSLFAIAKLLETGQVRYFYCSVLGRVLKRQLYEIKDSLFGVWGPQRREKYL